MGSVLSIDYGLKRIGLAVSDPNRVFSFPCGIIENKSFEFVMSHISELISKKNIDLIIIGMPLNMQDKGIGKMAKLVQAFVKKLKKSVKVKVETVDERLSSFSALENLKEIGLDVKKSKKHIDEESARLMLQDYLLYSKND